MLTSSIREGAETEAELREQLKSFGRNMEQKKALLRENKNKKDDEEDRLRTLEKELSSLVSKRGQINGEKIVRPFHPLFFALFAACCEPTKRFLLSYQTHENAVRAREETAQAVCNQYEFKGYDYSPLEAAKIEEIVEKIQEIKKRQEQVIKQKQVRLRFSSIVQ